MHTGAQAEVRVCRAATRRFKKNFLRCSKSDKGYDFRDELGKHFIEVKGTTRPGLDQLHFRILTKAEYEKAREAIRLGLRYQLVIVTGIGTDNTEQHWYEAEEFVPLAKEKRHYTIPISRLRTVAKRRSRKL
jgi:hypothetical protein